MKINRIITIILSVLMLASAFASCSRRDQFRPPETDMPTGEQTTVAGQPDVSNPGESDPVETDHGENNTSGGNDSSPTTPPETTPTDPNTPTPKPPVGDGSETPKITGNPYEGWTAEELYASFYQHDPEPNHNTWYGNTPYYVLLDMQDGGKMFSKLTGQVVSICKDPLCDHESCIFSSLTGPLASCQVVDDRIYLVMDRALEGYTMYSFDLLMDDPKVIGKWSDPPELMYICGEKAYYMTNMKLSGGRVGHTIMVYDLEKKMAAPLMDNAEPCRWVFYQDAYIWYTNTEDGSIRRYDLENDTEEIILSGDLLNRENGELWFKVETVSKNLVYYEIVMPNGVTSNMMCLNMETGERHDMGAIRYSEYNGTFYTLLLHNSEAYKDDPHYEYYQNTSHGTRFGGKLFRIDPETGETETAVYLYTDGIPDALTTLIYLDGTFVMIEYQTYKDFRNTYSPNLPEWVKSRRYVVVNLETGQIFDLGVDLSKQTAENPFGR